MNTPVNTPRQIGLIFGKFYPLHCGHIYLIEKAVSQVDELHVILGCEQARDLTLFENSNMPKHPQVKDRFSWLQKTFKHRHNIHIHILDEAGIAFYPNGWKDWSDRVKDILQKKQVTPNVVFTSEPQDVANHALYYGCEVRLVDADRDFINISATKIRQNPYQNWQFIAKEARPFFVKRVAIIADDHCNQLPQQLANIYNTEYVSNGYINYINHKQQNNDAVALNESDYIRIAILHRERIEQAVFSANRILFTSLDFKTLHRYYKSMFNQPNSILQNLEDNSPFDCVIHLADFKQEQSNLAIFDKVINVVEKQLN